MFIDECGLNNEDRTRYFWRLPNEEKFIFYSGKLKSVNLIMHMMFFGLFILILIKRLLINLYFCVFDFLEGFLKQINEEFDLKPQLKEKRYALFEIIS